MIRLLENWKNAHQLEILIICIILTVLCAVKLKQKVTEKQFNKYSIGIAILYVLAIFYITVFSRQSGQVLEYDHEIFWSYRLALTDAGYRDEIGLNILMFVPLSVIWSSLVNKFKTCWYLLFVIIGACISVCIEYLQYYLQRGFSEVDDVISNVLGMILGIVLWNCIQKLIEKSQDILNNFMRDN